MRDALRVIAAPITRTVRHIPTEIPLVTDDGLPVDCTASFDNLQPINRHLVTDDRAQEPLGSRPSRSSIGYCDGHVERDGGLKSEADIERPQ